MVFKKAAPKKRIHHRAAAAARRHFSSRGGVMGIAGSFKPVLDGGIAQVAASVGNSFLPTWGGILGLVGTGYFMKNETLMTIGGMHAAAQFPVAGMLGGITGNGNGGSSGGAI
jgi:hypothetical protein